MPSVHLGAPTTPGELLMGERVATGQDRAEVVRCDRPMQAELLGEAADPAPGCLTAPRVVVLRRSGDLADVVLVGVGAESSDIEHERLLARGGSTQLRGSATTDRDNRDPHRRYRCAIQASQSSASGAGVSRAGGRGPVGQGMGG